VGVGELSVREANQALVKRSKLYRQDFKACGYDLVIPEEVSQFWSKDSRSFRAVNELLDDTLAGAGMQVVESDAAKILRQPGTKRMLSLRLEESVTGEVRVAYRITTTSPPRKPMPFIHMNTPPSTPYKPLEGLKKRKGPDESMQPPTKRPRVDEKNANVVAQEGTPTIERTKQFGHREFVSVEEYNEMLERDVLSGEEDVPGPLGREEADGMDVEVVNEV
jgi:hypothetical protein